MNVRSLAFVFLSGVYFSNAKVSNSVGPIGVVSLALDITSFIMNILEPDAVTSSEEIEQMKNEIITAFNHKIEILQSELESTFQEALNRANINEVSFKIESVMIDLKDYIEAEESTQDAKKEEFLTQAAIIMADVRSLADRLEAKVSDDDSALLQVMVVNSNCNMTAFNSFKDFYMSLTEDAVTIELTYKHLKYSESLDSEINRWNEDAQSINNSFETRDTYCKTKFDNFDTIVENDLMDFHTIHELSKVFWDKYTWYINDIFILTKTHQKLLIDGNTSNIISVITDSVTDDDYRKYVVFTDRETRENALKCVVLTTTTTTTADVFAIDPNSPAKDHVSTAEPGSAYIKTVFQYDHSLPRTCNALKEPELIDLTSSDGPVLRGSKNSATIIMVAIMVGYGYGY